PVNQVAALGEPAHGAPAAAQEHSPAAAPAATDHAPAAPAGATSAAHAATDGAAKPAEESHDVGTERMLTLLSVIVGLLGIGLGVAVFAKKPIRHMPAVLENKYYVDEIYETSVIGPIEETSRHFLWKIVDVKLIDGTVNGVARLFAGLANGLRHTQSGYARSYAAVILLGAIVVIGYFGYIAMR
ncbi:MAG: hypothetical protein SF339_29880, partial [Blastocatellia bacterium]|nr:hypothetical protein [Blastocatellia bacterium]